MVVEGERERMWKSTARTKRFRAAAKIRPDLREKKAVYELISGSSEDEKNKQDGVVTFLYFCHDHTTNAVRTFRKAGETGVTARSWAEPRILFQHSGCTAFRLLPVH